MNNIRMYFASALLLLHAQSAMAADTESDRDLARELGEFRGSIKEIKRAANRLSDEFNRSNLQILEYDQFMNDYINDKPVPDEDSLYQFGGLGGGNTGTVQGPPLPPRPQWVQKYEGDITELSSLVKSELSDVFRILGAQTDVTGCQAQLNLLIDGAGKVSKISASDNKTVVAPLVADLLDDASQLDLSVKRIVRQRLTDNSRPAR